MDYIAGEGRVGDTLIALRCPSTQADYGSRGWGHVRSVLQSGRGLVIGYREDQGYEALRDQLLS